MVGTLGKILFFVLIFVVFFVVTLRGKELEGNNEVLQAENDVGSLGNAKLSRENERNATYNEVVIGNKKDSGTGGGGEYDWGWGGGGGGGGGRGSGKGSGKGGKGGGGGGGGGKNGGWGWGSGGGGFSRWKWGQCRKQPSKGGHHRHHLRKRSNSDVIQNEGYKMGEFAQCMLRGRCSRMRLDCPLHCGGHCFYDCIHMCKAHCKR